MKIFALDCASGAASVALLEGDKLLGETFSDVALTHSQTLLPMAQELFQHTRTAPNEMDLFTVSAGPGSFTGVRIGIAAVKGLADAVHKPCMAVSALEAAAYPFRSFDGIVCAAMDARCNQVYTALFQGGERILSDSAMLLSELGEILQANGKPVLFCADGAKKTYDFLSAEGAFPCTLAPAQLRSARASSVAYLAAARMKNGEQPTDASALLPVYLRLPQAQRELNNKNKSK
ncbi:MAG: tRNA (adenosine(37)-N6)-threonylcarbamoyltransferase complex dimerization subunit type 1 TsaB, partial [Candidatus Fimenecus sp.]